ncbi:MAG: glutamate 5-kinase [Flavobacteriales bacterium]|nr:glutamate 5-kinase [Flavobacteriales bacterium]
MDNLEKSCIVIKLGTATLTDKNGNLSAERIESFSNQINTLLEKHRIVLVSSGAVGIGKGAMKEYSGNIIDKKTAAAIGNPHLIQTYSQFFNKFGIHVAQFLVERKHFSNRHEFLQLRETIYNIWKNEIIPIVNENDVVSDKTLQFSDNDELATLFAISFNAKKLLIGSSVDGLLDRENETIPVVKKIDNKTLQYVRPEKSSSGTGGMESKLTFTRLACSLGVETVIFDAGQENSIIKAMNNELGTTFLPKIKNLRASQKWIGAGGLKIGKIKIDKGATKALKNRKSLLAVGVKKIMEDFLKGEVIEIFNNDNNLIAYAKAKINSNEVNIFQKGLEVAHADNIVIV